MSTAIHKRKTLRRISAKRLLTSRRRRVNFLDRETLRHSSPRFAVSGNATQIAVPRSVSATGNGNGAGDCEGYMP
jgi:hypothetical protein